MDLATVLGDNLSKGKFWTDAWTLVEGCTPVSPGCANCWLAGMGKRFRPDLIAPSTSHFNGTIRCREDRLDKPLHTRKSKVYAVWSDLFHEEVPREFVLATFATMAKAKQHNFILVTKRPHVAAKLAGRNGFLFPNVTFLVTMEDQERFNARLPHSIDLAQKGWRVGILAEPLLSGIDASSSVEGNWLKFFRWVLAGGESGPHARPCHPSWVRALRDQAKAAGVPFLFKAWGEWAPYDGGPAVDDDSEITRYLTMYWDGKAWEDVGRPDWVAFQDYWDPDQCSARVGKKMAGRELDGEIHSGLPEA